MTASVELVVRPVARRSLRRFGGDGSTLPVRAGVLLDVPRLPGVRRRLFRAVLARQRHQPVSGKRRRSERGGPGPAVHHRRQLELRREGFPLARLVGAVLRRLPVVLGQRLPAAKEQIQRAQ